MSRLLYYPAVDAYPVVLGVHPAYTGVGYHKEYVIIFSNYVTDLVVPVVSLQTQISLFMKFFRRIILLSLALLVLVSSTGFSVGVHFCGGEIRDLSLNGKSTQCLMAQQKQGTLPPCHAPDTETPTQSSCCDDHQLVVERLDVASDSKAFILNKVLDIKFVAAVQVVFLHLFAAHKALAPAYALYEPPLLTHDIPVLAQSFLI
ncbi:HYC_CC_PP family protein [Pontibacter rugosus]